MIVDGGVWMYKFVSVANSVRDAARYGSVTCGGDPTCDWTDVRDRAIQSSSGFLDASDDWEIGWIDRSGDAVINDRGDSIVVKVHHDHQLLFFPFSFGVASCVEMRLEGPNSDGTMNAPSECS